MLELPSASAYLDIPYLVGLAKKNQIEAVHPGYGFLSESAEFARRMWHDAGAIVVGPGWETLQKTGDKIAAKALARECHVPTLPANQNPTDQLDAVCAFAQRVGFPVMLKAVDGGGGKGIRLVQREEELDNAARRAIAESPSRQIFVEKAAIDGFRHIEVQIIGDGYGGIRHLWERECSIQRRYQKVVEVAPSTIANRRFVAGIIQAAVRMAERVNYLSLGTFEFLANPITEEYFFLEVNPRLQVEHTVTESILGTDLVSAQLAIAQGGTIDDIGLAHIGSSLYQPHSLFSVQLRLTAENVQSDWSLSIGKITEVAFPTGNGIRVDTHLVPGHHAVVGADFDSLLAKIIVTGASWHDIVSKCQRALEDTSIEGVKTNLDVLRATVAHPDFASGAYDTTWLERELPRLLETGREITKSLSAGFGSGKGLSGSAPLTGSSSSAVMLRKGDAWAIKLAPKADNTSAQEGPRTHHLKLTRILRNEFPSLLRAEVEYSQPGAPPSTLLMEAASSNASAGAITAEGKHRRGDPSNPGHVVIPFPGKLVEVLVDEGDVVQPGQVVCVVQQMKMELEVRASCGGRVKWITEVQDGEDVAEGMLIAELDEVADAASLRSKL